MTYQVIALVGPIASGKGSVIDVLKENGYDCLSLSDVVRERAKEWGLPLTRENLQDVGDKLRKNFGPGILAELISSYILKHPEKKYIVDGVRNPAELLFLKKKFSTYTVGVTASADKRFELMRKRAREWDPKTREEFDQVEARDRGVGQEEYGQQVQACLDMADIVIDNNGFLSDLQTNIGYFLPKIIHDSQINGDE